MSYPMLSATPTRPLPGAYMATPAPTRPPATGPSARPPSFRIPSSSSVSRSAVAPKHPAATDAPPSADAPVANALSPIDRAANAITQDMNNEERFPPLEDYVTQGISAEYDIPESTAWAPFQKMQTYDLPDRIFEHYNTAEMSTMMGLFAELHHAWITIDNALYIWDYTHPNPELLGFDEQSHTITAVKLATPRPGVFVNQISHLLVITTMSDIFLVGLESKKNNAGIVSVSLYSTGMQTPAKNMNITCVASSNTGRIFVGGKTTNDVYEITYQQEEKWFSSKCGKINHTAKPITSVVKSSLTTALSFSGPSPLEHVEQIVVDDSRGLLYTLSSLSTIRVFHIKPGYGLPLLLTRTLGDIMSNIAHMVSRSELLASKPSLASITPISAAESDRLNLMATTSNGVRIYLSSTSGGYYASNTSSPLSSMQVQHVKFPPSTEPTPTTAVTYQASTHIDTNSQSLTPTRTSLRFPPGYFLCFVDKEGNDVVFLSAPDTARIARPSDNSSLSRYLETGQWLPLLSRAEDVGLITPPFAAGPKPLGFGNELAVQFNQPATEIAILTNTGVHTVRRRRLVDIFASVLRNESSSEDFEGTVTKFIRLYGRTETCATALAVACNQAVDVTDARVTQITDNVVIDLARRVFVEHGGKPTFNENSFASSPLDNVSPSPRAEGLTRYLSRLVSLLWKMPILKEKTSPGGGFQVVSTIPLAKLQSIQRDITRLREFLDANKSYIEGLAGPEALQRAQTRQDEVALQGEHRTLNAIVRAIANIIEGIAFVIVLFDEPVDEIVISLNDTTRQRVRQLTYEVLVCTDGGKELGKELVKAIVNRSIAKGGNVDTVADALRRRCGSFCSADDVVIFKAQEQLKRAHEAGADTQKGRGLLNESLRLFQKVAGSLPMEQLEAAVGAYVEMSFYAGAIRLALTVAESRDRANRALQWIKDGSPDPDPRKAAHDARTRCYKLVCDVMEAVDNVWAQVKATHNDVEISTMEKRKSEAYSEINGSSDEVFQTYLYDWYLANGWDERLLDIESPHVVNYLQRRSTEGVSHANLLWLYYSRYHNPLEAAKVQLQLAKSGFGLKLSQRIEYLSRAKANVAVPRHGFSEFTEARQSRQEVSREINDMMDVATIQEELLQRLTNDPRVSAERQPEIEKELNGPVLPLDDLYQEYADQASYYDISLIIYNAADYRNSTHIAATWENLIKSTHERAVHEKVAQPYEIIASRVKSLGKRLNRSDITFPISVVLPILLAYAFEHNGRGSTNYLWPVETLFELNVPYESIITVLEDLFYRKQRPWDGPARVQLAKLLAYVIDKWYEKTRHSGIAFGSEENIATLLETLKMVLGAGVLSGEDREEVELVMTKVGRALQW
ncbi:non-repetitive nucleoporin [Trichodelitschia bisporula]|uniref:Non-repetitive nucleoporin n=1 Tax=Trichodelitschia bisporula TaxID=703511 RepID=A0A6G1I4X9_9PEZI|nr:non-repetitive nucleoporin [Trichodelitschia bisporula]